MWFSYIGGIKEEQTYICKPPNFLHWNYKTQTLTNKLNLIGYQVEKDRGYAVDSENIGGERLAVVLGLVLKQCMLTGQLS